MPGPRAASGTPPGRRGTAALPRRLVLAGAGALLGGCGFRPLYAPGPGGAPSRAQADLATVYVALMPERSGQLFRQALQRRFEGAGSGAQKRYELTASLGLLPESIAVQRDNSTTRVRIVGTTVWALRDLSAQRNLVTSGTARTLDGYNVINQQFFALEMENEAATRRVAEALADQVTLQLSSFFANRITPA